VEEPELGDAKTGVRGSSAEALFMAEFSKILNDGGKNVQVSLSATGTRHDPCFQRQMLISEWMMLPNETI